MKAPKKAPKNETDLEYVKRVCARTTAETLKSWEGVLIPGISNEDALAFMRSSDRKRLSNGSSRQRPTVVSGRRDGGMVM